MQNGCRQCPPRFGRSETEWLAHGDTRLSPSSKYLLPAHVEPSADRTRKVEALDYCIPNDLPVVAISLANCPLFGSSGKGDIFFLFVPRGWEKAAFRQKLLDDADFRAKIGWDMVALVLEVKNHKYDAARHFLNIEHELGPAMQATTDATQIYKYARAQYISRPQRFLFSLTICGDCLRVWHWNPCGVEYTELVDYKTRDGAKYLMRFVRGWCTAEPYLRGEDVAPGGCDSTHRYTFVPVPTSPQLESIRDRYQEVYRRRFHVASPLLPVGPMWKFARGTLANPSETNDPGQDIPLPTADRDELGNAIPSSPPIDDDFESQATEYEGDGDYSYLRQRSKNKKQVPVKAQEKIEENGVPVHDTTTLELDGESTSGLILLGPAIFRAPGLWSRATQCYVAVRESDLAAHEEDLKKIRFLTLKCSYQHANGVHEIERYRRIQGDHLDGKVKGVARALGGGTVTVANVPNCHSPPPNQHSTPLDKRARRLDWLVMEGCGVPLHHFPSLKVLIQAFRDAINGQSRSEHLEGCG